MHLAAFPIAGPVAHSHAVWRRAEFLSPELYQDIARTLERGTFDLAFFADRLAMADTYGHSLATA
jgi:alkanesulfonate monooxygenase SsuD/methylene tetrahydromethanopterin reductase-like flavin-dependent oxidoreductase (luciferase family)